MSNSRPLFRSVSLQRVKLAAYRLMPDFVEVVEDV